MKYLCVGILFCMLGVSFVAVDNSMIGKKEVAMYQDSEFMVEEVERDIQYFEENRAQYTYIAQALLAYTHPEGADVQRVYIEMYLSETGETLVVYDCKEETKKAIKGDRDLTDAMMRIFKETDYGEAWVNEGQVSITTAGLLSFPPVGYEHARYYEKGFYYNLQFKNDKDVYLGDGWYFVIGNNVTW